VTTTRQVIDYPFTAAEMSAAAEEWGANCGPAALAFALQTSLARVRGHIPGFEEKRYTSPTMMAAALDSLGAEWKPYSFPRMVAGMFAPTPSLVRVQFTGPWTAEGANPRWAYRHTHWIAAWRQAGLAVVADHDYGEACLANVGRCMVFDCNGGIQTFESWKETTVPVLTAEIPRADGGWHPTHVWRVARRKLPAGA
jgi:hypothetical protein